MDATVYIASTDELKDTELFEILYHSVPEYRRQKIDRMRFDKDKRLSLGVGVLLARALHERGLAQYLDEIAYSEYQKPYLPRYCDVHFNLSHSEERVMCAIGDAEIGCDVEYVNEIDMNIARKFFFDSEYETIASQSSPEARNDVFYRLWTLKESFMKATGLGFNLPLNAFCIKLDSNIRVEHHVDDAAYTFAEFSIENNYKYACCVRANEVKARLVSCSFIQSDVF